MRKKLFFLILTVVLVLFFLKADSVLARCDDRWCTLRDCHLPDCDTCSWCAPKEIFGPITLPGIFKYGGLLPTAAGQPGGLVLFLNNLVKLLVVIGGLFALLNIILAGYGFMSAGDDPKKMATASAKIWQSLLGLLIVAGSFVLAAIFGWLLFGNATAILSPKIYGP